jgi:hypothetical protein
VGEVGHGGEKSFPPLKKGDLGGFKDSKIKRKILPDPPLQRRELKEKTKLLRGLP